MPSENKINIFRQPIEEQASRPIVSLAKVNSECKKIVYDKSSFTDKENLPIKTFRSCYVPKFQNIRHSGHGLSAGKAPDAPQTTGTDIARSRNSASNIPVGCHGSKYIKTAVLGDKSERPRDQSVNNSQDNNTKYCVVPREASTYNQVRGERKCHSKDDCENSKLNSDLERNVEKPFGRNNGRSNTENVRGNWTGRNGSAPGKSDVDNNAEILIKSDRNSVRMEGAGQVIAGYNDRVELQTNAGYERDRVEPSEVGSKKSILPKPKASLIPDVQKQAERKSNFIILRKMSENTRKINMRSIGRDENANFGSSSCNDASDFTKNGIVDEFKSREENNCFDGAITSQKIITGRKHDEIKIDKNRGLIKVSDPRGGRRSPKFVKTQTDAPSMSMKRSISSDSRNSRREESRLESFHVEKISVSKSMRAKKQQPEVNKDKLIGNDSEVLMSGRDSNINSSSIIMDHGDKSTESENKFTNCSSSRTISGIKGSRLPVIGRSSKISVSPCAKSNVNQNKGEIVKNEDSILPPNKGGVVKTEIIKYDNKKPDLPVLRYNSNLANCKSVRLTSGDVKANDNVIINTSGDAVVIPPVQSIDREVSRLQSTYIRVKQQRSSSTNTNSNVSTEQVTSPGEGLKCCTGSSLNSTDNVRTQSIYVTDLDTQGHGELKQPTESEDRSQRESEEKERTGYTKRISRLRAAGTALRPDLRAGSYFYWGFGSKYTTKRSNYGIHGPRDVQDSQEGTVLISNQLNTDCYGQMDCTGITNCAVRRSDNIPICNDRKTLHSKSKHINKPDLNQTLTCLSKSRNLGDSDLPIVSRHDTVESASELFCNRHGQARPGSVSTRQLAGDRPRTRHGETRGEKTATNDSTRSNGHKIVTQNKTDFQCSTEAKYNLYESTTCIRAEQGNLHTKFEHGERVMNELVESEIEGLDVSAQKTVVSDVHLKELNVKLNKTVNRDNHLEEGIVNSSQLAYCKNSNTSDFKDTRPTNESVPTCRDDNFIDSETSLKKQKFEKDSKEINSVHSESKKLEQPVERRLHCNVANIDSYIPPTRVAEAEPRRPTSPSICQDGRLVNCLRSSSYPSRDPRGVRYDNGNPTSHGLIEATYTCAKISNNNKNLKSANSVTFTDADECGDSFRLIGLSSDTEKSKLCVKATGGKVNDWSANRSNRELIYDAGSDDYERRLNVPTCTVPEEENIDVAADDSKCQLTLLSDGVSNYSKQSVFSGDENWESNNNNERSGAKIRGVIRGHGYDDLGFHNENFSEKVPSKFKVKTLSCEENDNFGEKITISKDKMEDVQSNESISSLRSDQRGAVADADDQMLINSPCCDKINDVQFGNSSTSSEISHKNNTDVDNVPNDAPVGVANRHNTGSEPCDAVFEGNSDCESETGQNAHSSSGLLLQVKDINGKRDISSEKTEVNIDRIKDTKEHGGETSDNGKVNVDKLVILSTSANRNIKSKHHEKDKNSNVSKSEIGITKNRNLKAKTSTSVFNNMQKSNDSAVSTQSPKSKKQIADGLLSREQTKQKSNKPASSETGKVSDKNISTESNKNEKVSTSKTSIPASSKFGIPGQSSIKTKTGETKCQKVDFKLKSKQSVSVDNENVSRKLSRGTKLGHASNSQLVKRQNSNSSVRNSNTCNNSKESSPEVGDRTSGKTVASKSSHRQVSLTKSDKISTGVRTPTFMRRTSCSSTRSSSERSLSRSNSKESSPDVVRVPEVKKAAAKTISMPKSKITSPKVNTKTFERQISNSSSRSSSRQSSKESSPEVVSSVKTTSTVKSVASLKTLDTKTVIPNTSSTKTSKPGETNTRISNALSRGSKLKLASNIPGPGVGTKTQANSAAVKNGATKTLPVAKDNKTTKCISKTSDSKPTISKSSQSSPALSRSSRSSTPSDKRTKDSLSDKSPKMKRAGLKLAENRKSSISGPTTRTINAPKSISLGKLPLRQISNTSDNSDTQRAITPSSRASSVLSCKSESDSQTSKLSSQNVSKHAKLVGSIKSRTENVSPALSRKSRSNTPSDNSMKKVPVQSKSTVSQKSYDKSPVAQRKTKQSKLSSSETEKVATSKETICRSKTKAVMSKLPMANTSKSRLQQNEKQSQSKGSKPGTITLVSGKSSMANALESTRKAAVKDKTSSGEKKNFKSDITKNQDSATKKIKITTGDYLTNQTSVQSDTGKKLPSKFDLSTDTSSTSISNKNYAKMQQMNSSAVENHTKERKNSFVAHESRCVMSDCRRENETESNSKTAIEICNQNLSSGDLFTNACDQEFAANSLLGNCTDILTCSDDNLKDIDFKCLSCSDTETSEDYWSVSGDENSELEKWDQNDYSEAMEYLVLSNHRSLTPTSVDFEGDRGLIPDDEVKQLNDNVCNNIYQEQRNILSEKQLCIKETSLRNDTKLQNLETQEPEVISSGLADDKVLQATQNNDIHCLSETFCNNNVPFDIRQGNIRPSSKCKSIRENSESNSALVCRKDKEQYGSEDIKEERFLEQANSVEYFDENVDKSDALINEVSEGAIDPKLRGNYFREWGDVLTVGSGDNMSHLSMKNIMTHSNSGDGICYISDSFTDSRLGSSLLNVDSDRNEISNCASVNEHQNVGLITNLEENNLDQIDTTNLPTSRHDTELKESEKEINSKDTEYSCVTTLQSTVDAGSSEEPRGSNFGLDEESDYSEKENDDFCSLSSGDEIADYNTHADANMNDMCIKKEVSGEDSRKITRHRRVITRRERSIKYETVTTKIPKEVHGEKNALPVTTSSVSLLTQNADDGTSRVVQTTIQRSVTSSKNITSTITSQYSHALSGENIQTGKWMSSSLLSANVKDYSESLSTGLAILNQEKVQNCGLSKILFDPLDSNACAEIHDNEEGFYQIRNAEVDIDKKVHKPSILSNIEEKKGQTNDFEILDSDLKHSKETEEWRDSETRLPGRTEKYVGTSVEENEIKNVDLSQKDIKVKCVQQDDSEDNLQVQISNNADPNCHTEISEKIQTLNNTSDDACITVGFHIEHSKDDARPLLPVNNSHSDSYEASQMVDMNTTLQKSDTKDIYLPEITEKTDKPRQAQYDSMEHYQTDQKAIDISQLPKKSKCDDDFIDKETSEHKERHEDGLNSKSPQVDHSAKRAVSERQPIEGQRQDALVGNENHKSLGKIEMSDSAHHKNKDDSTDEVKKPTIKISDSGEESTSADGDLSKQTSNDQNGTLSRIPSKKDRSRQGIRRFTATVCLIEKDKDTSAQMTATQKPRARSKSPIELRNEQAGTVESKQLVSVGHGRVSEICQSFLKKASRGTKSEKPTIEHHSPAPSAIQSPALGKKLKWVNEGGKWKRIPIDMIEALEEEKSAIKSTNINTNVSGDDNSSSDNPNSEICTNVIESVSNEIAKFETFASPDKTKGFTNEEKKCSKSDGGSGSAKPKQPPKTLPKPSEESRRRMLGKNAVAKWASFSQKRLSWKLENEKTIGCEANDNVHDEIYQTLPEKHVRSPPEVMRSILHAVSTDNEKSKKQSEEGMTSPKDHKSCASTSNDRNTIAEVSTHLSDGQNKNSDSVRLLDLHPQRMSVEKSEAGVDSQSVGQNALRNLQTVSEWNPRKQTETINNGTSIHLSKVSSIEEDKKLAEDQTNQQVTSCKQSISLVTDSTVDIPYVDDTWSDSNHDESIDDSDDEVTPTNTPKLRKSKEIPENDDVDVTPRNTPRIKAVKIKQEMFPREEWRKSQNLDNNSEVNGETKCAETSKAEDATGSASECVDESDVKFYIDDDDMENINILRKSCARRASDQRRRGIYGMTSLQDSNDDRGALHDGVNLLLDEAVEMYPEGQRSKSPRDQLLSEIVELEDNVRDASPRSTLSNTTGLSLDPCGTPSTADENKKNFNRSQSLPTTSLNGFGQPRIVYKDGHFVIETGLDDHLESEDHVDENNIDDKENMCETGQHSVKASPKEETTRSNRKARALTKRRSNSEADLLDKGPLDDDSDLDVFLNNDGEVTVIEGGNGERSPYWHVLVKRRTKPLNDHSDAESSSSRPLSIDESQLQMSVDDLSRRPEVTKSRKADNIKRRSASFKELRSFKLKRNSSFREAQERGALLRNSGKNDSVGNLSLSPSEMSIGSETRSKGSGILNRMFRRNKSFNEKGSNAANESLFEHKRDSSREPPKNRKMSLKSLFGGKKTKSDSSQSVSSDEPPTPPIAVFQSDLDIHAVDSAPNSPYASQKFHRRYTAADLYEQRAHTLPRRPSDTSKPQNLTISKDHLSVKSLDIQNLANHPKRPISPKPVGLHIPRRNSNVSLPISSNRDVMNDVRGRSSLGNRLDYCDSVSVSSGNSAQTDVTPTSPPLASDDEGQRSSVTLSSQDVERYVQGGEMTSSNSNDSGIQRDVSLHSSNESLKTIQDSSTNAVVRRRKSPSPRHERPKSEISVRWADLVETNEITPVKRRERLSSSRQRPKSDLEDNLSLFDEMYQDVIEDYDFLSGGSSLSDDMKPFGSQLSLLPYSSLQSLDQLRRQDSFDQKPNKRRMSTPHPIKTRLERSPKKQRRRNPLVRSHSMPENLDKLYKKRRFFSTASSNLHKEDFLRGFDEDSCSDDGSDYSADQISLHEKSLSSRSSSTYLSTLEERPEAESLTYAEALWDHITMDPEELGFRAGDVIEVADMTDKDWWWGAIDDKEGWFPATFVRLRVNQERLDEISGRLEEEAEHSSPLLHRMSVINKEQARENVVNEILTAERDYVKHLKDVVEGYIKNARKRTDMFNDERISVLFGNMESIYDFSDRFLQKIEKSYQDDHPHLSELGQCFLTCSKEFEIYSDYCNNHPSASEELKELYRKQKYRHFFEACRLLQEMIEIPLEGFLLTPVQKICKYPLQLAELLKYTPPSHPDHQNVTAALEAMKKIAALINERKRKMESIEKLARWQAAVEDWQGANLIEESSELIYSGEMYKVNSAGWSQERCFFLFDHQLIYCKKDLLKRNGYSYRGRVDLDDCEVLDIEDGKDSQYNVTVKNGWKLHETVRDKWYLLYTKTETEKQKWLKAFKSERQRVKEDQENNFVPCEWKRMVLNKIKSSQERGRRTPMPSSDFVRGVPSHATLPRSFGKKAQKKKGWFNFGNKKTK